MWLIIWSLCTKGSLVEWKWVGGLVVAYTWDHQLWMEVYWTRECSISELLTCTEDCWYGFCSCFVVGWIKRSTDILMFSTTECTLYTQAVGERYDSRTHWFPGCVSLICIPIFIAYCVQFCIFDWFANITKKSKNKRTVRNVNILFAQNSPKCWILTWLTQHNHLEEYTRQKKGQ